MFKRILVPLDETLRDDEILAVAQELARRSGATAILMHLQEPITGLPAVVGTNHYLDRRVRELRAQAIEARYYVDYGQPPHEIEASAEQEHPDLIIIAPQRRAWLEALRHPSVTVRMIARASVPVLVWPEHAAATDVLSNLAVPGAAVLVPLDGSALAERALPFATRLAREYDRPVLLLRVVKPVTLAGVGADGVRLEWETQGEALRAARTYLGVTRKRLERETSLDVQSVVLRGSPSQELVRIAGSHIGSVMVLSTHGRNGFERAILGSVAVDLLRQSPMPLFIIPPLAWKDNEMPLDAVDRRELPAPRR